MPTVRQVTRHELDLMFGTGLTPTSNMPSPQKAMDEKIPEVLKESTVTTPISDKSKKKKEELSSEEKPLSQREKIRKIHVSPIGGNTIPIKYSKEIGRYGGIERPTSTEARQSQKNTVQAAENFFGKQENAPRKERSISLNGVPMEELAWDYHDGTIQVPTTRAQEMAPDVVVETRKGMNKSRRRDASPSKGDRLFERKKFTSLKPFKEVVQKQVRQNCGVTTLPWPTTPKIYKRKMRDPVGKLYSDEAIYGDEKDDLFAKAAPYSSEELDLFDTICEWCKGDHLVIYCPYKQEGSPTRRPKPRRGTRTRPTICWNCGELHYYRDCPEKEWHGKLERAKEQ